MISASVVAAGAQIGSGARIERSVLLDGAVIGRDAVVTGSVVMGSVGDGASVTDCVIGADGHVGPGEYAVDVRRPDPDIP